MKFKIGDAVTWESSSNGSRTRKTGKVVEIVPPKVDVDPRATLRRHQPARGALGYGLPRDHESYIVAVAGGKTDKAMPVLYWPLTSKLRLARKEPARSGSYAS